MRATRRLVATVGPVALLVLAGACTRDKAPAPADDGVLSEAAAKTSITEPKPEGNGSFGNTTPPDMTPTMKPAQAGGDLAGQALPTNQWWTSALTGPLSLPMWAHPLAVRTDAAGMQVSSAPPAASAKSVVTPFIPALTVAGPVEKLAVTGYGAFHVALRGDLRGGGALEVTIVQGSPLLYVRFLDVSPSLTVTGAVKLVGAPSGSAAKLDIAGQRWDVLGAEGSDWKLQGNKLTGSGAGEGRVAVARVPDGVDAAAWDKAVAGSAGNPVVETTARMAYDASTGVVRQTLTARRASGGPGVWALLPHHKAGLIAGDGLSELAGSYPDARGTLSLATAERVRIRAAMPGLLTTAPTVELPGAARAAVLSDLDRDLADKPGAGGSYFGLKELGRLATIAEVSQAIGAADQRQKALDRLRPQLVDWLTYGGGTDGRYFSYDKTWGGLIAIPAEFGSSDYNDHHFQYGYLVRAAAVLAQADPAFAKDYGSAVDMVARDFSGALSSKGTDGFPPFRNFSPYNGHSYASGFAPFADGNNQESSAEAVAAWEAVTRWGVVRDNAELTAFGVTHYAMEATTARAYWLGETVPRPKGYAYKVTGIVFDSKIDYATFFDPKPESVQGIQLLPLTFGSLYRADPKAAAARSQELAKAVGRAPRIWGDLFAADLAVADPKAARALLGPGMPREESTSRGMVRYWVEALAVLGPPQPGVVADGPYGLAFGDLDSPKLLAVNPTGKERQVTFRRGGTVTEEVSLKAGQSASR